MHSLVRGYLFLEKKKKKRYGRLLCYACFGLSRGREIGEPSIIVNVRSNQSKIPS